MQQTRDYTSSDTTAQMNDLLTTVIKNVQQQFGLKPTGKPNDSLLSALNVPAQKRIEQIIINMNRPQWVPVNNDSNRIKVNIPSQMLYVYNDSGMVMEMPVIIDKQRLHSYSTA
ncbi:MAG: hypothetical protein C4329_09225 [Chitinophagaceae bacterium]